MSDLLFTLTVKGNPIPKQSVVAGKNFYSKPAAKEWQETVAEEAFYKWRNSRHFPIDLLEGELGIEIVFYRGNKRKVDTDNLSKPIKDALNNIVYKDDSQIVDEYLHKRYDKENPRVEIKVFRRME